MDQPRVLDRPAVGPRPVILNVFGLTLGLCGLTRDELVELRSRFPPAWRFARLRRRMRVDAWATLRRPAVPAEARPERASPVEALGQDIQGYVSEHARTHVFVHAAVIVFEGLCVVLPGVSGAGKSTLARALVNAGGTYFSDEYAAIDSLGLIHSYARPIALRSTPSARPTRLQVDMNGRSPRRARRADLIVETRFRRGAVFRPTKMDHLAMIAVLVRNSVASRLRPRIALESFVRATRRARGYVGDRGSAAEVIRWLRSGRLSSG